DYYRLDQLDTSLRNCIQQLLPLITEYDNSVAEWDQWDDYMQVTTTDTPWTRQVYRIRMMFFKDESRLPPLPEKVQQLIQDYNNTIVAVRTCRDALDAQAHAQAALNAARSSRSSNSTATSRATTPNPAAAHPAANGATPAAAHPAANGPQVVQSPRDTPNSAATHTMANENRSVLSSASTNASAPTTADELRRRARRFEELNAKNDATPRLLAATSSQSPVTDPPRSAQSPRPTSQPSTTAPTDGTAPQRSILKQRKQQVPIVTELDHGDRSPPGQEDERNDGFFGDFLSRRPATWYPEEDLPQASLFSVTDGNVHAPSRPAVLDKNTAKSAFYTDFNVTRPTLVAAFSAPTPAPTRPSGSGTTVAPQRSTTPVGPTPHSGYGTTGHEAVPPPYVSPPLASSNTSQAPDQARTTTHQHHAADDQGRTILTPPHPTPPPSDQHVAVNAPATAPATHTTDPEAASAFYRAANCSYKLSRSIASPALVLKEIPIEPFEGDIRKYPTFRARFLETMNSYQDLEPRHRLQYLLQYLKGTPRKLFEPFPLTDEYYWTAIDFLEERYGNKYRIRTLLQGDILALSAPSKRVEDLQKFHDSAFSAMQVLKQIDYDVDTQDVYGTSVLSKLPDDIRREIVRHPRYTEEKPLSVILAALRQYLNEMSTVEETGRMQITVTTKGGPNSGSNQRRPAPPAHHAGAANQYTFAAEADTTCAAPRDRRTNL
ncbi:Pao retrotransposon peptidase family protein-like, partial [Aphelenchoides avenae]